MFRNIIKNTLTDCPYRFRTEEELIERYDEDWRDYISWNSNGYMDYLFGQDFPFDIEDVESLLKDDIIRLTIPNTNLNAPQVQWYIQKTVITPNNDASFHNTYLKKSKDLVYENILTFNEYKKGNN